MSALLLIGVILSAIVVLLYGAPSLKVLNFVDYGSPDAVVRVNRYAAIRLLIPVCVSLGCAIVAARRPDLAVPLIFAVIISILVSVVWIAMRVSALNSDESM